jgi:DNA-directed RNA polymerase subunit RPC12/RpoP
MERVDNVLAYKCPCCGAGLVFSEDKQKMMCEYCDNTFDPEAIKQYNEIPEEGSSASFQVTMSEWTRVEYDEVCTYTCQSCGGTLITDQNTAATFCPYCENPVILPGRISGGIRPDAVIPFQTSQEDAQNAFLSLCKGKPLLPKFFSQHQRIEKITGLYVPFWLYDCSGRFEARYKATRVHHWMDAKYSYTRTDHYLLARSASSDFTSIPMDASSKIDNTTMESIEPFDFDKLVDFNTAYLSGFCADKYDIEAKSGQGRIEERIKQTFVASLQRTLLGYTTVIPTAERLNVDHGIAKYVLLPVWMLHTRYKDKTYVFAMNGQTGKMTGKFPICPKRSVAWFAGICAAVTALISLLSLLV